MMSDNGFSGFVAGTLVHTDKGLVPIQDLKVGDMVMSKPESGEGEAEYKSVLSTFKSPKKEKLYKVAYHNDNLRQQGKNALGYILCTGNHPFWVSSTAISDINAILTGDWTQAEDLAGGYLTSAHEDTLSMNDFACLPVRTLPNFPKGCAYTQEIFDRKMWQYDETYNDVRLIQFTDTGYHYISYAGSTDEGVKAFNDEWGNGTVDDIAFDLNHLEPITINPEVFTMLFFRMMQDNDSGYHSENNFKKLILREDVFFTDDGIKNTLEEIKKYGNANGLKNKSIHLSMRQYNSTCPNPYKDYVYNIEVSDYHTYFVGHDGILVNAKD